MIIGNLCYEIQYFFVIRFGCDCNLDIQFVMINILDGNFTTS